MWGQKGPLIAKKKTTKKLIFITIALLELKLVDMIHYGMTNLLVASMWEISEIFILLVMSQQLGRRQMGPEIAQHTIYRQQKFIWTWNFHCGNILGRETYWWYTIEKFKMGLEYAQNTISLWVHLEQQICACVRMSVCMHACICVCACMRVCVIMCAYVHVCMCVLVYVGMYICNLR